MMGKKVEVHQGIVQQVQQMRIWECLWSLPWACWNAGSRVQSRQSAKLFLQSSELGLPQPLARRRVTVPPPRSGGRGTLACERGRGWESPNSDKGTYTVVLFIYTYFVVPGFGPFLYVLKYFSISVVSSH